MTRKPPLILGPIVTGKMWKSPRRKNKVIVFEVGPYKEHNIFSVREHVIGTDGIMRPTTRGVALVVRRLPEFAAAVQKALKRSRELELLPDDERDVDTGEATP